MTFIRSYGKGWLLCLVFFTQGLMAQDLQFERYGIDEGLSQGTVSCMLQDKKGFIWFGTRDGLNKYDGYQFTVYKRHLQSTLSLNANDIKAMVEDAAGNLWIATWSGGLNVFDPKTERFTHFVNNPQDRNSIASNYIRSLLLDHHGNLWIGTNEAGLDCYNPTTHTFSHYTHDDADANSLSDNTVTTLYEDDQHTLWIGTMRGGMNRFNPTPHNFTRLPCTPTDPTSLPNANVQFMMQDSHHRFWVGTYGGGLRLLDRTRLQFKAPTIAHGPEKHFASTLLSITEDASGNLWIGTENEGLHCYHPDQQTLTTYRHYENDNTTLGSNSVTALYTDTKGNVWIGTFQGGINLLNRDALKFKHYRHTQNKQSISGNAVTDLFEDSGGNLWIATDGGGLNRLDATREHVTHFHKADGLPSEYVMTVREDQHHQLWMGTWAAGIAVYNPTQPRYHYYTKDPHDSTSLSSDYVYALLKDRQQRLWVGTYGGGLNLYNPTTDNFTRFTHKANAPTTLSANYILTLFEDHHGTLWIGTDGGGLNAYHPDTQTFTAYQYQGTPQSISNNIVSAICETADGYLWLGTNAGLDKFDPTQGTVVASYYTEQGLPTDLITGILTDRQQNLWIGTAHGLSRFTPATGTFKNFTLSDGIQDNEFRAECTGQNGRMYFGGKNGFNAFDPETVKSLAFDPPLVFTGFKIFNKEVPIALEDDDASPLKTSITEAKALTLTYQQSVMTFEFASLNYIGSEKKQYRYRLKGFDKDWNYVGTQHSATYTNLNPGPYTFEVEGLTNEGHWSTDTATLDLIITPPFWKTWWFKLMSLLALTGIIGLSFYIRLYNARKRNRALKEEVRKRTHELTEANYSLLESNEEIKLQKEKLEALNVEMGRKSDKILEQQEKIIRQNQVLEETVHKLERTNNTKDRFFSILAHDLKNPVTTLTGVTDVLKDKLTRLNPAEVARYVDNMNRSAHAMHKLIKNLLDWAKTHSHDIPYTPVAIPLNTLLDKILRLVEQQVNAKLIRLTMHIHAEHFIYADYQMVDTIIRNLLSNSIKFTPLHGTITMTSQVLENDINLIVEDSGVGMTQATLDNLFSIGQKNVSVGTAGETGTGLGLIVTKEFLEANKGSLAITSTPGKGSTFSIRLPRAESVDVPAPANDRAIQPNEDTAKTYGLYQLETHQVDKLKDKRILIVDDNKEIREFLRLLLSSTCEIVEAENGEQGMAAAIQHQPAIIISDMIMPVMNGLDFCRQTKTNPQTSHIPVILLTSQVEDEHQLSGYEAGADVYLMKPVKHNILLQVIYNILMSLERLHQRYAASQDIYPKDLLTNKLDEAFMEKVVAYIEQHLAESDLDHKKICEITSMSRSLLYHKIKTLTGHGVHDLIKSIRLKKGLQLLLEGTLNVTQVAFEVGFTTPSHFSKSFSKQYGASPSEYLANLKKNQT